MRHTPPKSVGRHICHTLWSFHLKCGKDHGGCRQIYGAPKGSLGSHLGLRDLVHVRHYMLDGQCYEFLNDTCPTVTLASAGEPNDPRYAFPVTYWDAKAFVC